MFLALCSSIAKRRSKGARLGDIAERERGACPAPRGSAVDGLPPAAHRVPGARRPDVHQLDAGAEPRR